MNGDGCQELLRESGQEDLNILAFTLRRRRVWNQGVSLGWNHHEVMHGINPKENTRDRAMPYACGDSIHDCVVISYQSFGLDKKERSDRFVLFLVRARGLESRRCDAKPRIFRLCYAPRSVAALTCHWHVIHYRSPSSPLVLNRTNSKRESLCDSLLLLVRARGLEPPPSCPD